MVTEKILKSIRCLSILFSLQYCEFYNESVR